MSETTLTKIGELAVRKSELMNQRHHLITKICDLKNEKSSVLRQIREINYQIEDLQQLPKQGNMLNLNDAKGKK